MTRGRPNLFAVFLIALLSPSRAFTPCGSGREGAIGVEQNRATQYSTSCWHREITVTSSIPDLEGHQEGDLAAKIEEVLNSYHDEDQAENALRILEDPLNGEAFISEHCYGMVLDAVIDVAGAEAPEMADRVWTSMINRGLFPDNKFCDSIISIWAKSMSKEGGQRCVAYLDYLWREYDRTRDSHFVPVRSSYISTITALTKSRQGRAAAEKADKLLEELEVHRIEHPQLTPNTLIINGVLNTWSKSGVWKGAATRCEKILDRMIQMYPDRQELKPDTRSFNTVIDCLAKSKEANSEGRAEALLDRMYNLNHADPTLNCRPDQVSYNTVLNAWAQSKKSGAARRATDILNHMQETYLSNASDICPDSASYTTVVNAWSRSRDKDAVDQAEDLIRRCEESFDRGNLDAKPNALTYNSLINCYAKSRLPGASEKALGVLDKMKTMSQTDFLGESNPDVVTYTSVIDTLAKQKSEKAAEVAVSLLEELEGAHLENPGDRRLMPNIRTYTSVINAIGRSRSQPERAEALLNRIEKAKGDVDRHRDLIPDTVCFNAVINAYGWSKVEGKAQKCFEILQRMMDLFESGQNVDARPDIVTCNSVLNACSFDKANTDEEHAAVMDIAVKTLEIFQSNVRVYGHPDHSTYAQVLSAIKRHMPEGDKREAMALTTFYQCCTGGHLSSLVVSNLEKILPWPLLEEALGGALISKEGQKAVYDLKLVPREWTRHAPKNYRAVRSRASKKRNRGFQVTKASILKAKRN